MTRIPATIRMLETVRPDFPFLLTQKQRQMLFLEIGHEYQCSANAHGAVFVTFPDGEKLGVKPGEFEVVTWAEEVANV